MMLRLKWGHKETRTVLKNISLTINKGDFVGIMGRNGAGKSTLLKLIAGIYHPNSGEVVTHGKLAPLLELGAGFETQLNGYENIFLNGSILGFSRQRINSQVKAIIDFSELGDAIERPVRNYSSGMLVRLAFSIAVHLGADIFLFDEILAVGDVGFQEKCLAKINQLHREGRTIILVTHSPEQVEKFCDRCIVFDSTGVVFDGAPSEGARSYNRLFHSN
jgi:ABC-2 type transport system ATP-binding protein